MDDEETEPSVPLVHAREQKVREVSDLSRRELEAFVRYFAGEEADKTIHATVGSMVRQEVSTQVQEHLGYFEDRLLRRVRSQMALAELPPIPAKAPPAVTERRQKEPAASRVLGLLAKGCFALAGLTVAGYIAILTGATQTPTESTFFVAGAAFFCLTGLLFEIARKD